MRARRAVALAAAWLLVPVATAHGATVRVVPAVSSMDLLGIGPGVHSTPAFLTSHASVDVRAAPRERNDLTVSGSGGRVVVRDASAPLLAGDGCAATAPGEVTCGPAPMPIVLVAVDAGDGDDRVDGSSLALPLWADGGAGDDVLMGGADDDVLAGGDGRDRLIGDAGGDRLTGGPGADRLDGGDGGDTLDLSGDSATALREFATCGAGEDEIDGPDGQELVSTDCDGVRFPARDGTPALSLTLPLRRGRHGAWTRVSCWGDPWANRCRARVTLRRRNGWPPLHGRVSLRPSARPWARLRLHGARLHPYEALWVRVRGTYRDDSGRTRLRGGFKVVVP